MLRNTAGQKLTVFAFNTATNAPVTGDGPNISCRISIDDGAMVLLADTSATEVNAVDAKGYYTFDLTQAETNGLKLLFFPESATAGVQVIALPNPCVYTELAPGSIGAGVIVYPGEDPGLMEQDGVQADTYIDRFLAANGVTVPIDTTTASAVLVQSLADIGAHLTVWYGFHHRGLEEMGGRMDRSANDIAGLMSGYKDYADAELAKLLTIIENENTTDDDVPAGTFETLAVVDSSEQCATDENGNTVAPLSWWM